jgi:hypothetical protein
MQKPRADLDKLSIPRATAAAVPFVKPAERPAVSAPAGSPKSLTVKLDAARYWALRDFCTKREREMGQRVTHQGRDGDGAGRTIEACRMSGKPSIKAHVRIWAFALLFGLALQSARARTIRVELLDAAITPQTAEALSGLSCRNVGHIVHLRLAIRWPSDSLEAETSGYKRLIFWNQSNEFLFPFGTYGYQHGDYIIDGYFIARSGGIHQGVVSNAFEKIADTQVLLNPSVEEVRVNSPACK